MKTLQNDLRAPQTGGSIEQVACGESNSGADGVECPSIKWGETQL